MRRILFITFFWGFLTELSAEGGPTPAHNRFPIYPPIYLSAGDQFPFSLMRLASLPQSAEIMPKGSIAYGVISTWSNTVNYREDLFNIDTETLNNMVYVSWAPLRRVQLDFLAPVITRGSGVLDKPIRNWHDLFGLPQGARSVIDDNRFSLEAQTDEKGLFSIDSQGTSVGVSRLGCKIGLFSGGQSGEAIAVAPLARISQAFPSRAGQESVNYESAHFLSGDTVLKHIEVDKDEQTRSLPAIGSRSRNKLEIYGLDISMMAAIGLPAFDASFGQRSIDMEVGMLSSFNLEVFGIDFGTIDMGLSGFELMDPSIPDNNGNSLQFHKTRIEFFSYLSTPEFGHSSAFVGSLLSSPQIDNVELFDSPTAYFDFGMRYTWPSLLVTLALRENTAHSNITTDISFMLNCEFRT